MCHAFGGHLLLFALRCCYKCVVFLLALRVALDAVAMTRKDVRTLIVLVMYTYRTFHKWVPTMAAA